MSLTTQIGAGLKARARAIIFAVAPWYMDRRMRKHDLVRRLHESRVFFFHIPKTGGISIGHTAYGQSLSHRTWREWREWHPVLFRKCVKCAVIREPTSRFVSAYDFLLAGARHKMGADFGDNVIRPFGDINKFVLALGDPAFRNTVTSFVHFIPQAEYVATRRRRLRVNRLVLFERIQSDVPALLGIAELPPLNVTPGKRTAASRLSAEAKDVLREIYADDYALYEFAKTAGGDVYGRAFG